MLAAGCTVFQRTWRGISQVVMLGLATRGIPLEKGLPRGTHIGSLHKLSLVEARFLYSVLPYAASSMNVGGVLLQRLVRLRKLVEWAPLVIVSALEGEYLHLSLILATSLSVGGVLIDLWLRKAGAIKVCPSKQTPIHT